MRRLANVVLGIAAGTLACGGFSKGPVVVDEYRGTLVAARRELETHVTALREKDADCSAAMSAYANAMQPLVFRMESLSRSMDLCAGALGFDDGVSYIETCQSMRAEIDAHVNTGCTLPLERGIETHEAALVQLLEAEERAADGMQRSMDVGKPECAHD